MTASLSTAGRDGWIPRPLLAEPLGIILHDLLQLTQSTRIK